LSQAISKQLTRQAYYVEHMPVQLLGDFLTAFRGLIASLLAGYFFSFWVYLYDGNVYIGQDAYIAWRDSATFSISHLPLIEEHRWGKLSYQHHNNMMNSSGISSADYIVVGGGIAGCTLAARLQKTLQSASVLFIEAGPDPYDDPQAQRAAGAHLVRQSHLAWHLNVVANLHLGGRSLTADVGRALGGGGAINGGGWTRGITFQRASKQFN
jgi:GMC oxidoreductase